MKCLSAENSSEEKASSLKSPFVKHFSFLRTNRFCVKIDGHPKKKWNNKIQVKTQTVYRHIKSVTHSFCRPRVENFSPGHKKCKSHFSPLCTNMLANLTLTYPHSSCRSSRVAREISSGRSLWDSQPIILLFDFRNRKMHL